ncbi:Ig-like domain-containing protein [Pediococcus acidilactici]|uniref:Ig-like domain-containing protein n=1 Tax=Pediococcus acidilactici TaxID=1254 RepID=UPI001330E97C|nr:Ig-like domain-containing protein [Pediococcus acidilactici]MCQ9153347.1 Ig-like domain-containing protein [Pediococcus acidilactici]MCQ9161740.1 Ig-like domain-containing protein [Pediococcus acidilactici]
MNKNPKNHRGVVDSKVSNFKMYKVNKHWIFASALMLSMLGAGMMQTDTAAHADTVNEPQTEMVHKAAEAKEALSASVTPAKETTAAASSAAPSSAAPAKAAQSSIQNDSAAKVEKGATASSAASSAAPTKAASSAADKSETSAAAQPEQKKADAPSSAAKAEQKNDASASKNEQKTAKADSAAPSSAAKPAADGKDNKAQANNSSAAKPADNSSASNSDASVKKEGVSTDEIGTSGLDTNDQNDINNDAAAKAKADANAQAKDKNAVDNKKVDKDKTAKDRDPRAGISVLEDGSLAIDGSAADGLTLNEDGTYDGNLHFKYTGNAVVAQIGEDSNLILQIPPQLRDLFSKINQTGNWTKYFSGDGKFTITPWPLPSYTIPWTYTNSDFSYDGSTLILKNKRLGVAIEQKTTEINLNFNIGQAVTDFKEQIDNAGDNYTFRAAVIEPTDIIDWHPIGDYAGIASLNTSHLMPTRDELNPPTVNQPVYDNTTTLTGKGEPNAEIVITLPTGGTLRTHTNENGDFSIAIPAQPAGSEISVSQNVNGQTSDEVKVPVQKAPEVIEKPGIDAPHAGSKYVTGTGIAGDTIQVYMPGVGGGEDVMIGTTTVGADGKWRAAISDQYNLVEGESIYAVQIKGNSRSDKQYTTVLGEIHVDAPIINPIEEGDKVITGTGEAGSELRVYFQDGDVQIGQTVIVRADGTWTVDASHYNLTKGTVVYAVQTRNNVDSERAYSTVKGRENVVKPGINPIREGDQVITGTGVVGDEISVYFQDGDVQIGQTVTVQADGTWQVDASHYNLTEGTIVYAIQSRDGMNSEKAYQTVLPKPEEIPAPTFDNVREGATTITGRGEAGDTVYVYVKGTNGGDDILVGHATVRADGTWSVATGRVSVYEGDQLYAYQTKGDQQSSNGTTTVLPKQEEIPAPTFDEVREGASTITGRGEAGDTVYVYVKGTNGSDDILVGHATVKADGTWSVATGRVNLFEGDQLYAYQTNGDQQSSDGTTTVLPKPEELPAPSFDEVREGASTITGRGEAGDIVYVYVKGTNGSDDVLIGHATVKADGTWSVNTGRVNIFEGDQLYAYQTNGDQKSPNGTTTVLPKPEELPAPSFDEVREGASTITGRGEAGDTVYVYVKGTNGSDDILIGHTTVKADGTWSLSTGRVNLFEGDQLYAYQTNGDQQSANGTTTVLPKPEEISAPTFDEVKEGDDTISGQGEAGDTVYVYVKGTNGSDDILIGHTTVGADGTWSLSTGRVNIFEGDQLYAYQTKGDQQSPNGTTVVQPKPEEITAPTFSTVTEGDTTISGQGEAGDTVYVYVKGTNGADDIVIGHTTVGSDGTWTLSTGRVKLLAGDELHAYQTKDGKQGPEGTTIVKAKETVNPPSMDGIIAGDSVIKGKGKPGATVTVTLPNGDTLPSVKVDANGNWTVNVGDETLKPGDKVTAVQADGDNVSDPTTQIVQERTAPPVINDIIEGDKTISGTGIPGATVTVTLPNGDTSQPVTVDAEGNWTLDVSGTDLKAGDKVTAVQAEGDNVSEETTQTVQARTEKPVLDTVTAGDPTISGTGVPGATVTVTVGGKELPPVMVDEDGNWTVDTSGVTLNPDDEVTATQTVDGNTSEAATTTVQPKKSDVPAPGMDAVKPGAKIIKGSGKTGNTITVVKVDANGKITPIGTATVDEFGDWSVNVPDDVVLAAGDTVRAVQTTPDNVSSDPKDVIVG